ncbi:hypothetical protein ABIA52_000018 [Paenarthrobacter histidinolovorans]|uniref:Uncharacterized protein n=1 Tax=Paenarthrobacter histidinolovorans TaxID=43664 RepID=A0ABW8N383_9MICC
MWTTGPIGPPAHNRQVTLLLSGQGDLPADVHSLSHAPVGGGQDLSVDVDVAGWFWVGGLVCLPLVHMGTAKAISFGLFPHTCGRRDPSARLHTTARSPCCFRVKVTYRRMCTASVMRQWAVGKTCPSTSTSPVGFGSVVWCACPSSTWARQKLFPSGFSRTHVDDGTLRPVCAQPPGRLVAFGLRLVTGGCAQPQSCASGRWARLVRRRRRRRLVLGRWFGVLAPRPHGHGKSYFLRAFPAHMWTTGPFGPSAHNHQVASLLSGCVW